MSDVFARFMTLKLLSIVLALGAGVTGLVAARRWYKSSQASVDPGWGLPGSGAPIEPVDSELRALDVQVATDRAFGDAGALNASAARWTAASVLLSAASAIVGSLA